MGCGVGIWGGARMMGSDGELGGARMMGSGGELGGARMRLGANVGLPITTHHGLHPMYI